jgi:hypothetical protein
MMRKAAAAAHDATAMIASLRKRTDCWKKEVSMVSDGVACSLKILRQFIQLLVQKSLESDALGKSAGFSVEHFHSYFPHALITKLVERLTSLMSIQTQSSYLAMMGGDRVETERLFQSLRLYKEAIGVWGECVPLFYSSDSARSRLLQSTIEGCSGFALQHLSSLEKLPVFPTSDSETQFYKLNILSRRFRVQDLLNGFVSKPFHFLTDVTSDVVDEALTSRKPLLRPESFSRDPHVACALISVVGGALEHLIGDRSELERFYLALCHRCQSRTLLLDGFYAATETESEDRPVLSATGKPLSTGDTLRVSVSPSPALQFDVAKCSDSIAVFRGLGDDSRDSASGVCSVHQRASKVWGTVLSTQQYSPKTGVHRWAVRLEKCERGHVFIGVSTAQATLKTYVGGDKYGWGMIGTQALWHDRRKVRRCSLRYLQNEGNLSPMLLLDSR